jgi:chromatin remodeling complex protein RSC6
MAAKKKAARKAKRATKRTVRKVKRAVRKVKRVVKRAKRAAKKSGKKRTPSAAFMKPVQPSNALAAVIGSSAMPRTEVTKKLWQYIKRNGLQDSKKRIMINADDRLRTVFGGRSQVSMFEMTKLVSRHLS